MPASPRLART